ncbi:MAG: hypothetical protein RQ741_13530 [Wenzhouxiangellaceae bacterium]|nr:hypothetical protein [Wenzhouxiangellaceae bacterium]
MAAIPLPIFTWREAVQRLATLRAAQQIRRSGLVNPKFYATLGVGWPCLAPVDYDGFPGEPGGYQTVLMDGIRDYVTLTRGQGRGRQGWAPNQKIQENHLQMGAFNVATLKFQVILLVLLMAGPGAVQQVVGQSNSASEVEELKQQIELMQRQLGVMQSRVSELEQQLDEGEKRPAITYDESAESAEQIEISEDEAEQLVATDTSLDARITNLEEVSEDWMRDIYFGGAVRLNYAFRDFDDQNKDRNGDFEIELFRINTDGEIGDVILSAEWRRYNDFQAIHHAWVGYNFTDSEESVAQLQVGISQVPFGLLPFASHSFWFGGTYYLGYEDDYDTGFKFVHEPNDDWTFHYAFYKNPEYANDSRFGRYSFDLVTQGDQQNAEINQLNFRAERHLKFSPNSSIDAGISLQGGQIYNGITEDKGERYAIAGHINSNFGPWNLQLQGLRYNYDPENPDGVSDNFIQKGAFDFPFLMAAEANVYSANLARAFQTSWGPISGITCYNDFTYIDPKVGNSSESVQNVTGCSVVAGGVFAYFDWIAGKNMWFAGGDGIGRDATTAGKWRSRLNINIGYYF